MSRIIAIALCALILSFAGCASSDDQVRGTSDDFGQAGPSHGGVAAGMPAEDCVVVHVLEGVIQLHRVVVTLDGGTSDGVRVGMKGVLATGRPLTVISVDVRTSRAALTGLNLRIAPGTEACLY